MMLADRVVQLKPSATLTISAKAQEMKAQGKDIISLSVGEPDFPTPEHICLAAKKAVDDGFHRYTAVPGMPEVRKAAAEYFNTQYQAEASMENIIISNGGKQCLYNIFQALINPGDQVLLPAPYWVSYPAMIELAGGKAVIIPSSAKNSFKVSLANLDKSLTPKTRMLLINSPSNPTGTCYTQEETDAIAEWAIGRNLVVVSDEIYDQLTYDGGSAASFAGWWKKYPENFLIVNGVAKTFAMTGWRVGYTLAHAGHITAMSKLQSQSTSNVCSIAQKAALAALTGGFDAVWAMRAAFERRRDLALEIIASWPDVVCPKPSGAFYLFPDVHAYYGERFHDSTELCERLIEKAGVACVPGAAFGDDQCIRFSYATSEDVLEKGLTQVGKYLQGL